MAEAEDVITDAARHATIYARQLWLRKRGPSNEPKPVILAEVAPRLDLLLTAVFGESYPLRTAQTPAIPSLLIRLFRRSDAPQSRTAVPATDGVSIWLPNNVQTSDYLVAVQRFRTMALLQAMRAQRGSAMVTEAAPAQTRAIYLILEAYASDRALLAMLPGMGPGIDALRLWCLHKRPPLARLPSACQPLEQWMRAILACSADQDAPNIPLCKRPEDSLLAAHQLTQDLSRGPSAATPPHTHAIFKDGWTGDLLPPAAQDRAHATNNDSHTPRDTPARSARMPRRPTERQADDKEDDKKQGVWMVQTAPPLEQAEDPHGIQRPADRDEQTSAEEFADALSELPEARLVSTPGQPKEILISDDPPDKRSTAAGHARNKALNELRYPEWDYRMDGYRHPGATVHLLEALVGPQAWVDKTLVKNRHLLDTIRRRFEMLRADRVWLRRQLDGDDIDLDAYIEGAADVRAGLPMPQALYKQQRPQMRDMAIMLLIDISGSTDSWLLGDQRIIDVEREALLLVGIALNHMGEPYAIQAFSGEGPKGVTATTVKSFDEPYSNDVAQRIAALEPQDYTRAGAALRHATAVLMQQTAKHRLLLLLSDGKPNDVDEYEGKYGIEDMRRAVIEAKLQGVFPFCLTIDRQAAKYLPSIFGAGQYALLPKPELLPTVLLDWMRRLASR